MPPRRSILSEISPNIRGRRNFTPAERLSICLLSEQGCSAPELATQFGATRQGINAILRKAKQHNTVEDLPRTGRPRLLSKHQERILFRLVRKSPEVQYQTLLDELGFHPPSHRPHPRTLARAIKRRGLGNWRCATRPKINKEARQKRLRFTYKYRDYTWARHPIRFSDKCSVQKGAGAD